jgi:hypothetical protein
LGERGAAAGCRDVGGERLELGEKGVVDTELAREAGDLGLPLLVRIGPGRVPLGLAKRLLKVRAEALEADRPGADERLVDEEFLGPVGCRWLENAAQSSVVSRQERSG